MAFAVNFAVFGSLIVYVGVLLPDLMRLYGPTPTTELLLELSKEASDVVRCRAAELMGDTSPQFYVDVSRVREREGRYADALAAAEQYVRLMGQTGGVPDWAGERVNSLRKKVEKSASAKN